MKFAKLSRKESWHKCAVSKIPPDPAGIWEGLDDVDSVNLWARYRVSVRTKQANETQLCMNDTRNQYLLDDHSVHRLRRGEEGRSHVGMAWTPSPLPSSPFSPFVACYSESGSVRSQSNLRINQFDSFVTLLRLPWSDSIAGLGVFGQ